ncbi:MAG TPA: pirin family protein [Oligoflexia bacterium]|nr:pirin family protein [Oligoflexia bacterium]HMR25542.1 pirin family protein [Oligoflexia bacterium]
MNTKKIKMAYSVEDKHWVGDGFYVHGLLRPTEQLNPWISPFILMDYASPHAFPPSERPKGVGEHPHRGFETVTLAYQGEVEHRDSSGGGGIIKEGDVQWMTAGNGIVHDEFHSKAFSKKGGIFEMVQLWVNLPKKHKMTPAKYQNIVSKDIPIVDLGKASQAKVIAGKLEGHQGPAQTFTPINIYGLESKMQDELKIALDTGSNTVLLVMNGHVELENQTYTKQNIIIFEQDGEAVHFKTSENFKGLLLNGQPIDEPVVAHGPFVMNTKQEIYQAIEDYQNGKMGQL